MLAVTREAFGEFEEVEAEDEVDVGNPVPATMAILGICFMSCAVLLAGLPPLSGFVAKIAIITGLLQSTGRSEEHTSELQSLMRISYAVFCLKKKKHKNWT